MKYLAAIALGMALAVALISSAKAQTPRECGPPANMAEALVRDFDENVAATFRGQSGEFLTLFANRETGTWTLTRSTPEMMCILGYGTDYVDPLSGDQA